MMLATERAARVAGLEAAGPVLVIGVGNEYCRDDGAGLAVARAVAAKAPPGVRVLERSGEGAGLLAAWEGASAVILCDAALAGEPPGSVIRLNPLAQPIPRGFFPFSSHAFGVPEAIALGQALARCPPRMLIYAIEGEDFAPGVGLTPAVARAVRQVARAILTDATALARRPKEARHA